MNSSEALSKMIAPGIPRPGAYRKGIIQIHITRACDKSCFGCTQGSNLGGKLGMIPLELFEKAVISLKDYFGVVGIFGGNPALHPQFPTLCRILARHIPFERRGLWCNHPKGNGKEMRATFNPGVSNLNVHLDQEAYDEFKRDWPESNPVGLTKDSRHSPTWVAMSDMLDGLPFPDGSRRENTEENRWELISQCDINQNWSAMIGVFRGHLRGWFCEVAGAQSILHQWEPDYPDTGVPVTSDWWKKPMQEFESQARLHCHQCGVPLRGYGSLAMSEDGVEQYSATHGSILKPKKIDRAVQLVQLNAQLSGQSLQSTVKYIQNSTK